MVGIFYIVNGDILISLTFQKANQLTDLQLTNAEVDCLLLACKNPNRTPGQTSKKRSLPPVQTVGKKPMVPKPTADVRFYGIHHWPEFGDKRKGCRVCSILGSMYCSKCKVNLCIQKGRDCFHDFHH